MTKQRARAARPKAKTANKRRVESNPEASPVNGVVPPVEHRFTEGNKAAVGFGRPKTLKELRELIQTIGAEGVSAAAMTKIELKVRQLFASKNSKDTEHLLSYGWGKIVQPHSLEPSQELARILAENGLTLDDARRDPLLNSLFALTGESVSVGAEAGDGNIADAPPSQPAGDAPADPGSVEK